ncbi:uncharacterized protein MONBRDRAFT_10017 [Monosiga brevicollis MX1]|uniref:Uncharacterized protein n=1 Tax=Monosiga brevicollis TaxID=81824 RepID=A9V4Y3_MONBE|nr:uncharacterized protein MONBRDRAFT_10017 [Monosiga brevicollis MX1]EDQ87534.1 predicted protein [Monosiga brevicollis MX1]|eukprot:XP_001747794.1 hypothetical protein [Monosiga brevicollis MX1]
MPPATGAGVGAPASAVNGNGAAAGEGVPSVLLPDADLGEPLPFGGSGLSKAFRRSLLRRAQVALPSHTRVDASTFRQSEYDVESQRVVDAAYGHFVPSTPVFTAQAAPPVPTTAPAAKHVRIADPPATSPPPASRPAPATAVPTTSASATLAPAPAPAATAAVTSVPVRAAGLPSGNVHSPVRRQNMANLGRGHALPPDELDLAPVHGDTRLQHAPPLPAHYQRADHDAVRSILHNEPRPMADRRHNRVLFAADDSTSSGAGVALNRPVPPLDPSEYTMQYRKPLGPDTASTPVRAPRPAWAPPTQPMPVPAPEDLPMPPSEYDRAYVWPAESGPSSARCIMQSDIRRTDPATVADVLAHYRSIAPPGLVDSTYALAYDVPPVPAPPIAAPRPATIASARTNAAAAQHNTISSASSKASFQTPPREAWPTAAVQSRREKPAVSVGIQADVAPPLDPIAAALVASPLKYRPVSEYKHSYESPRSWRESTAVQTDDSLTHQALQPHVSSKEPAWPRAGSGLPLPHTNIPTTSAVTSPTRGAPATYRSERELASKATTPNTLQVHDLPAAGRPSVVSSGIGQPDLPELATYDTEYRNRYMDWQYPSPSRRPTQPEKIPSTTEYTQHYGPREARVAQGHTSEEMRRVFERVDSDVAAAQYAAQRRQFAPSDWHRQLEQNRRAAAAYRLRGRQLDHVGQRLNEIAAEQEALLEQARVKELREHQREAARRLDLDAQVHPHMVTRSGTEELDLQPTFPSHESAPSIIDYELPARTSSPPRSRTMPTAQADDSALPGPQADPTIDLATTFKRLHPVGHSGTVSQGHGVPGPSMVPLRPQRLRGDESWTELGSVLDIQSPGPAAAQVKPTLHATSVPAGPASTISQVSSLAHGDTTTSEAWATDANAEYSRLGLGTGGTSRPSHRREATEWVDWSAEVGRGTPSARLADDVLERARRHRAKTRI